MKTQKNILIAFILNLSFSIFEYIGGLLTGSVAIISDSVHDLGDAFSIGVSWFLEKKSKKAPDEKYTYGYARFSVMGGLITVMILIAGSVLVIAGAVRRIITPAPINYDGMIIMAVIGVVLNFAAAWFTREGDSINQKAVNLHMLEDVLGWIVVLAGAVLMKFTDISVIDPVMSIAVAVFILFGSVRELLRVVDLFLVKIPEGVSVDEIKAHVKEIEGVADVHHIHVWSMDGNNKYATMHIVTDEDAEAVKRAVREELGEHGISHVTLEIEGSGENCGEEHCEVTESAGAGHHHHHH
ncbi:MAG: cation transporter [Clostridiales bacterium]|nr:cation transporter [Clostridiales bacterium]